MSSVAHGPLVYCLLGLLSLWQLWFVNTKTTFLLFCLIQATDSLPLVLFVTEYWEPPSCSVCHRLLTGVLLFCLFQATDKCVLVLVVTGCWQPFFCSDCHRLLSNFILFWLLQAADSLPLVLFVTGYWQFSVLFVTGYWKLRTTVRPSSLRLCPSSPWQPRAIINKTSSLTL